jgi:hypothetical protein
MIVLYRSTLHSSDAEDFLPMSLLLLGLPVFFFWLCAVSTLAWTPNGGQGTSQLVIVELLYCLCVLLDTL